MVKLYGIKTCDTCRKALKWLDTQGIAHKFHDIRADGLKPATLAAWVKSHGWENVLNKRSTTWREISAKAREGLDDKSAAALMLKHPTLIKRPVIDTGKDVLIGFTERAKAILAKH